MPAPPAGRHLLRMLVLTGLQQSTPQFGTLNPALDINVADGWLTKKLSEAQVQIIHSFGMSVSVLYITASRKQKARKLLISPFPDTTMAHKTTFAAFGGFVCVTRKRDPQNRRIILSVHM